jgi:hypothetical protein
MKRSFLLQASIVVSFLAGSSAATPLYSVYQRAWGFSPVTVTTAFAIYALAVLTTLLVVGSLSDYVGRRPVLLVASVLQVVSMRDVTGRAPTTFKEFRAQERIPLETRLTQPPAACRPWSGGRQTRSCRARRAIHST